MFKELLKQGKKIKIFDKEKFYTETTFYYKDNAVLYDNAEIGGGCKHDNFTACEFQFDYFVKSMLESGFAVEIF